MPEISKYDDVIDSRDVIERIEEIEEIAEDEDETLSDEDKEELAALKALADEASQYAVDWEYGEVLIRESYFVEYVREMLEDCGDIPKGLPSYIEIDWKTTARNVRIDYTDVDFDGVTYLIR